MRPWPRRRPSWLVVAAAAAGAFVSLAVPASAAPFDCEIGSLQPTDLDVGVVAAWPGPLTLGTPTNLSLEIDLGSGIATLPGFRGQISDVVVTLSEPGLEFTGGTAQLGRTEVLQVVTVTPDGATVDLAVGEPVRIAGDEPLPRIVAELEVVPREAGPLRLDTADLEARYVLTAEGLDATYETTCVAADDVNILIATVAGGTEDDDAGAPPSPVPTTTVPTAVMGETETLPHTGPSAIVWVSLILGLVVVDLGWALRTAARPDGAARARVSLFPRRW
jgi:hypothetical protein